MKILRVVFFVLVFLLVFNVIGLATGSIDESQIAAVIREYELKKSVSSIDFVANQNGNELDSLETVNISESWKEKCSFQLRQVIDNSTLLPGMTHELILSPLKAQELYIPANQTSRRGILSDKDLIFLEIHVTPHLELQNITPYLFEVIDQNEEYGILVAYVQVENIPTLARCDEVTSLRIVVPAVTNMGSVLTEGDSIHHTSEVRLNTPFRGKGIKVGVISNGVDHLSESQEKGDLPPNVQVLRNAWDGDEGIAILEIIHDIAPDAELYFHDGESAIGFINAVDALSNAGCNIICDDVGYFGQPYFEDGIVATHVKEFLETKNIVFISSAGNDAKSHYQGFYHNRGNGFHDFSLGEDPSNKDLIVKIDPGKQAQVILQWDDRWGQSSNNYDLVVKDKTNGIQYFSGESQNGDDDPIEFCVIQNLGSDKCDFEIYVLKAEDSLPKNIEIFVYPWDVVSSDSVNIEPRDSIFGHPAVNKVIAVGAIDSQDPGHNVIEWFSSQGPVTIVYPTPEMRNKPDICGIDHVSVTGVGGFQNPFFGTSASAPHIAGIAALIWSANPTLSADEIRLALLTTADDRGEPGWDTVFGYGLANATKMLSLFYSPAPAQYEYLQQWGSFGSGEGQFSNPYDVAVHPTKDRVYVADTGNHRIQVFSKNGSFLTSWGEYGNREVQFMYPNSIALNENLARVYTSEKEGDRVQILSENGGYHSYWGNDFWFFNMGGICVDTTTGNVFAADTGNNRVEVFDQDGNFIRAWGSQGTGEGEFQAPTDVTFDPDTKRVYVVDQGNDRIQVFNERGWYSAQFGTFGGADGRFDRPTGIALNSSGYVFVVDQGNSRIQVFNPNGEFVTGWGSFGNGISQFKNPIGIDVDSSTGYVYVADSQNNRIQVFKPKFLVSPTPTPTTGTPHPTPTSTTVTPTPSSPSTTIHADFTATPISGVAPLTVRFQDTSQGDPTGWMWDINGDGFQDYSENSFEHTYTAPGYYSVTFSITKNQELATVSRLEYIHVLSEMPTSEVFTLDLHQGWNFVSTPKTLEDGHRTVGEVFTSINTGGHSIFRYNAESQSWNQLNSQDEIQCLQGMWVYSTSSAQVPLIFNQGTSTSCAYALMPGWNAIGFPHIDSVSAREALLSVESSWTQLFGFNAESQFYETSIINGGTGSHSDENLVHPGKGYWVFMNEQGSLL